MIIFAVWDQRIQFVIHEDFIVWKINEILEFWVKTYDMYLKKRLRRRLKKDLVAYSFKMH